MTESGEADVVAVASAGVHDLARATTSVLEGAGPVGEVGTPVVRTLTHVWEGYFGAPIPPEGTNWNAYTHEQLYAMVWENADVTDVTGVADEWGRHSTELAGHADSLQRNRSAMQTHWNSESAEAAGGKLGLIGDRTSGVGERASAVSHATQNAGEPCPPRATRCHHHPGTRPVPWSAPVSPERARVPWSAESSVPPRAVWERFPAR